jgi:hypothetical protein
MYIRGGINAKAFLIVGTLKEEGEWHARSI